MTYKIASAGCDERGQYSGGQAGDQSGTEFCVKSYYIYGNGGWDFVAWHPKLAVRNLFAILYRQAADNDKIGYDQGQRETYYDQVLKAKGYQPKNIKTACETDCSASIAATIIAVGYILDIKELKEFPEWVTTYTMKSYLIKAGFTVKTASKFTSSSSYLRRGCIICNINHHVVGGLQRGSKAPKKKQKYLTRYPNRIIPKKGAQYNKKVSGRKRVKRIQRYLNWSIGTSLKIDGCYGDSTASAVKKYKKKVGIASTNGKRFGKACLESMKTFKKAA